jgi:hypothetical protein
MNKMKDKFQKVLDDYYDKKISLDDFIYHIQYLHREKFRIDSENLKTELHPKLQEILPQLIKKVEKKTSLVYYGIYDDFEDRKTELKHYMIRFQHKFYFSLYIELSFGQFGSKGSGEYEEMYIHDDNKVHLCISTPSCQAVWCECDLNDKKLMNEILSAIIQFNNDYTY